MFNSNVVEMGVLEVFQRIGKRIDPKDFEWRRDVHSDDIVIFCWKPWDNCQGIRAEIAMGEEILVDLSNKKIEAIFLLPRSSRGEKILKGENIPAPNYSFCH